MSSFFSPDWEKLDKKIAELESKIGFACNIFGSYNKSKWSSILDLCKEINDDFKNIRYPKKEERSIAWQKFFDLRHKAYQEKNNQIANLSKSRKRELYIMLNHLKHDWLADFLIGEILFFGFLKTKAEDMKWSGKKLNEAGAYFKSVKHEMTREDKAEIHQLFVDIRSNHDLFWLKYKKTSQVNYESRKKENQKAWEEKQRAWEEKKEKGRRIKNSIENNLSKNKDKLNKAIDALDRVKDSRRNLRDKISESYSDNWKSKAENWLDEMDNKISDIESSIDRIKDWISEDKNKLDNWS